jgi:hypothetical protein
MTFRFLGAESLVGDSIRLNRFGQSVDLTQPQAANAILGGCPLVDDETFCQIGFTKEDLERFASSGSHGRAPAEFQEKKKAALLTAHALRERLESGETLTAAEPKGE